MQKRFKYVMWCYYEFQVHVLRIKAKQSERTFLSGRDVRSRTKFDDDLMAWMSTQFCFENQLLSVETFS